VGVPHGGLSNLVAWHQKTFGLTPSNRATQIAAPTFDASVWEIWPYLTAGSSLHIPDDVTRSSPSELARWLTSQNVTHTFMPTPLAEEVLQEPWQTQTSLEFFLTGGDELRRVPKQTLPFRLTNQYGPTENTVVATWTPVENTGSVEKPPPIGRPIDNVRVYLVDRHLNPVPIRVSGELYIGGSSLSRGYVSRADLTAERFVPDPFSTMPGARLYRSGDLCRFLPEGDLEFRGRRDHQVKIRGFRIELGEIEAALTAHPEVREAVVLARADGAVSRSGQPAKRLVAYVVAERQPGPDSPALRSYLKERLPDYMVPAAFVMLDALPLTPNGKLDRKALPSPAQIRPEAADDFVLPRSDRERILAEIWSHVLHVDRIGIHDNFFELGGDSILSIQIVSKANQAGLRLTPKDIFQYQTVAELAQMAGSAPAIEAEQGLVTGPVPLTPIQRWFFDLELADPSHFNQAVLFELKQNVDPRLLKRAVESLMLRHDALRLRFNKEGQRWMQTGTDPSATVPFRSIDLSDLAPAQKRSALERTAADIQGSLDLSDGPLLQVALFDLGPGEHQRLLIVVHHLLVDGVSWRILLEDLQTSLSQGESVQLPAKTTSFARWAERLVEHARSPAVEDESSLWFGLPRSTVNPLPVDFENGENTGASSEAVSVSLSVEETEALLREIPEVYHTEINDVLLTAVVQAFATWTGDSSLLLDLEGHGREPVFEDVDVSRTVGWFTTIYPVLLHIENSSPGDALRSIKEQLRAIPNRGLNYGVLRYLKDSRNSADPADIVSSLPPPEISFNYLGQFDQSLAEGSHFSVARESSGPVYSPHNKRPWLLQVDGYVQESQLRLAFVFSKNVHRTATIEHLAHEVLRALQALISHCLSPEAGGFTPSDFPLASLDAKKLGRLAAKLASADTRSRN
jgi:non-ribosomal peptide synthase protein (TIGR01720 family)